jgi:hypothetical protein
MKLEQPMTEPINAANPYGNTMEEVLAGKVFNAEALMLYVTTRLNDLDADIQNLTGEAEDSIARKEYINEVRDWSERMMRARKSENHERVAELENSFPEPPPGAEHLKTELQNAFNTIVGGGYNAENFDRFNAKLDSALDEINGANELLMIRLQQLIAERQACISFVSNAMSTLNDTVMTPINNI